MAPHMKPSTADAPVTQVNRCPADHAQLRPVGDTRLRPVGDAERAAHVASPQAAPRLWPWVAGAAMLAAGTAAAFALEHFSRVTATFGAVGAGVPGAAPLSHAVGFDAGVLAWPGAAAAAILAAYYAVRALTAERRGTHPAWHVADHHR